MASSRRNKKKEPAEEWETVGTNGNANSSNRRKDSQSPEAGAISQSGNTNDIGQTGNQSSHGQSHQVKRNITTKASNESTLAHWTRATSEAAEHLRTAQRAMSNLEEKLTTHLDDVTMIEHNKRRLDESMQESREKEKEIEMRDDTISTLRLMDQKSKAWIDAENGKLERGRDALEAEKERLEKEKAKLTSRIEVMTEEMKLRMAEELRTRVEDHEESHGIRMKELEAEFARKLDENSTTARALEDENHRLSKKVEQQERKIQSQAEDLEDIREKYDLLKRAKDSLRTENHGLKEELEKMEKEFSLNTKPVEYYEQEFVGIQDQIERISQKYFHDREGKDLEMVHEKLAVADSCFRFVPIDESDNSRELCIAHAQRIISKALCDVVWKPFNAEINSQHPEFGTFLVTISDNLGGTSQDVKTSKVWAALTMRALRSLPGDTVASLFPEPKNNVCSADGSVRVDKVINQVLGLLSPLIRSSETESLRTDLTTLVASAVEVWNNSQAGGLEIIISPSLDTAKREEWRSHRLDPALPTRHGDESGSDQLQQAKTEIFTLFPHILARIQGNVLPGSWPEPELKTIYPGVGLPSWSPLVMRGWNEEKEREAFLVRALENAKKELSSSKRNSEIAKREARGNPASGAQSLSEQWKTGGGMKYIDR